MNQRAQYLIQVLEKIGSPLMEGLVTAASQNENTADEAQKIASLLAASVKSGIDIGNMIDINKAGQDGDKLRIALTALASPLIAQYFRQHGKVPDDTQNQRINAALQAVITFSDNFSDNEESTESLEKISVKTLQSNVQYIDAIVPVINAVSRFAFGQPEARLLQDIANKLSSSASSFANSLLGSTLSVEERKTAELAILRTLAQLYTDAHESEVKKLMGLDEEKRMNANVTIDTVWSVYETKAAMVTALAENLVPGGSGEESTGSKQPETPPVSPETTAPVTPSSTQPAEQPPEQPKEQPTEQRPPAQPPSATETKSSSNNPMAMFAKKPSSEDTPPASEPPSTEQPREEATPQQQPPSTEPPPSPPASEPPAQEQSEEKSGKSGNPMSFFKGPAKKEDGNDDA